MDLPIPSTDDSLPAPTKQNWLTKKSKETRYLIYSAGALLLAVAVAAAWFFARSSAPPMSEQKDYETYVTQLKAKIPIQVDKFRTTGLVADSYTEKEKYPNTFDSLSISVDRVYLFNKVTQKGGWYTKAHLTANNPAPTVTGPRGVVSVGGHFDWAAVEMLP